MDLKYLSRVQESQQQNKLQTAQAKLSKGFDLLAGARAAGYNDKSTLEQAARELIHALKQNRSETRAFIGLGYIFMLWGNKNEAWYYLNEARKLDPNNEDAQRLIRFLQENPDYKTEALAQQQAVSMAEAGEDLDLYEQTANAIKDLNRMVTQELNLGLAPGDDLNDVEATFDQFAALSTAHEIIEQNLDMLETSDNTETLRKGLYPIEVLLRRYRATLAECAAYLDIREQLAGGEEYFSYLESAFVSPARTDISTCEAHFEKLYDLCDKLADQLDAIESKQPAFKRLSDQYRKFTQQIEFFRDRLDEAD